jgi:hypothetical protein
MKDVNCNNKYHEISTLHLRFVFSSPKIVLFLTERASSQCQQPAPFREIEKLAPRRLRPSNKLVITRRLWLYWMPIWIWRNCRPRTRDGTIKSAAGPWAIHSVRSTSRQKENIYLVMRS